MIRLTVPSIDDQDIQAVVNVLKTGYLVQGSEVANFEQKAAEYIGVPYAIAVTNCTAALQLALLALDVQPGDLIPVTAYSWVATANVIELCGAQPVFVDILPDTFNMDPAHLEAVLRRLMSNQETAKRVKAVLPVHTFGQLADMPALLEIAGQYDIPVIEDAACALGASLHRQQAGTWGKLGCFSFHPRKAITTGEGGLITTTEPALAKRLRALRNHGADPDATTVDFIMPGFNCRMTEFQAAFGSTQMDKLTRIIDARRQLAANYDRLLSGTPLQAPVVAPAENCHVYQSYVALLPEEVASRRAEIIQAMGQQGIQTTIGTYHMPMTTYFKTRYGYQPGNFPVTDSVFARAMTLPLHEFLYEDEQEQVVTALVTGLE